MFATQQDFLHAIVADPGDDLLYRVYADWLEENNQEEYANLVRWQVAESGKEYTGEAFDIVKEFTSALDAGRIKIPGMEFAYPNSEHNFWYASIRHPLFVWSGRYDGEGVLITVAKGLPQTLRCGWESCYQLLEKNKDSWPLRKVVLENLPLFSYSDVTHSLLDCYHVVYLKPLSGYPTEEYFTKETHAVGALVRDAMYARAQKRWPKINFSLF